MAFAPTEVLIIAGGLSHERDVSLRSGRRVADALKDAGVHSQIVDLDASLLEVLAQTRPNVVWPLLHGSNGEDGAVRDVLELAGVPYVGSTPAACRGAWDKTIAKATLSQAGLQTPEFVALPHGIFREVGAGAVLSSIVKRFGLPLVVKPARGGSALGVTVVRTEEALPRAMVDCFAYGDVALVERFITGVEIAVSVLDVGDGPVALPPVEIVPDGGVYDYDARYVAGATEFFCPARLTPEQTREVCQAAVKVHQTLGLRHLSRTDLILDAQGVVWVLEANVAPGMTETSLLPQSIEAAGQTPGQTYSALASHAAGPQTGF